MTSLIRYTIIFLLAGFISCLAYGQKEKLNKTSAGFPVNYDDDSVGSYILPDLLLMENGQIIKDSVMWMEKRRPEILHEIELNQFGKTPPKPKELSFKVFDSGTSTFEGKAVRKQVTVYFTKDTSAYKMDLLIYIPSNADKPVPLFFIINFFANSSAVNDSGVKPGFIWTRDGKKILAPANTGFGKLPVEKFLEQGIGVATVYYGDIEPDFKAGIKYGIRGYYLKSGTTQPAPDEWGAIAAWSWGLSRAMDYFETDPQIDEKRIVIQGTSRLGKTVLWTGGRDARFKMVIASCSGEGGAALSRRNYGENLLHLTDTSRYFYQFAANYHDFAAKPDSMPHDAHMLIALMAPRPLLLQTGNTDYWSDPKGEFLAAEAAEPVYNLFGEKGPGHIMPEAGDTSLLNPLGYYMHDGGHGLVPGDWDIFIEFIKKYL